MIRLLVADAQCIVRMGLRQLCGDLGDFEVAGEATNGDETLEALSGAAYDMLVIDPGIPRNGQARGSDAVGLQLIDAIRMRHGDIPVLAFVGSLDLQSVKRLSLKGIRGFLTKDCDRETLANALRKVAACESFIPPDIAVEMMLENNIDREAVLRERLSSREQQIMRLICGGLGVKEIAARLFISSRTVSTYKARLMRKLSFRGDAEIFRYALESGLAGLSPGMDGSGGGAAGNYGTALSIDNAAVDLPTGGDCAACEHYRRFHSCK